MTLVKVNPANHKRSVRRVSPFTSLLDEFFNNNFDFHGTRLSATAPAVNVTEDKDGFHMEFAAPGLSKDDFKINIDKDQLTVSAAKESNEENNDDKYTRREFNYSSFSRTFTLPKTIDRKAINAAYENGVLLLTLPKKEEAKEEAREITIS